MCEKCFGVAGIAQWGGVPPFEGAKSTPSRGATVAMCAGQGRNHAAVVCLLLTELVRGGWSDLKEIFGGGQGQCQERLSLEPA